MVLLRLKQSPLSRQMISLKLFDIQIRFEILWQENKIEASKPDELRQIIALMKDGGLTIEGLKDASLFVLKEGDTIVGSVGLEVWGKSQGLLRSLVVSKERRGKGLGSSLVLYVIDIARKRGLEELFLLSADVPEYYLKFGFEFVDREKVRGEVLNSAEFRGACLDTASVMKIGI